MSWKAHWDKIGVVGSFFAAACCLGLPAILSIVAGWFRDLVLLAHPYLQQTKWLILYFPHFRTAKTFSASNISEHYRVMLIPPTVSSRSTD